MRAVASLAKLWITDPRHGWIELRLLIVDDNNEFLAAAKDLLTQQGVQVVAVATTGAEAIQLVGDHELDAVLVDVDLGLESGIDVATEIASNTGPPVVLISAYSEAEVADLDIAHSAVGFISKSDLSAQRIVDVLDGPDRWA